MNSSVHTIRSDEVEPVRQFLLANGWAHRVGSEAVFSQLIANSQRTAVAVDGDRVIGFARGITDGLSNGYISMVVVCTQHQRKGWGRALVQHITGDDQGITWVLRAGREGASAFFAQLGFCSSVDAMERRRLRDAT